MNNNVYNTNEDYILAPKRKILARVAFYLDATPTNIDYNGDLIEVKVDRAGQGKLFGFGVSNKATIKIRDINRERVIPKDTKVRILFTAGPNITYTSAGSAIPNLYVKEVSRDETTNELTIIAYDKLYEANTLKISELECEDYTIAGLLDGIKNGLGISGFTFPIVNNLSNLKKLLPEEANIDGTETVREILDDLAEVILGYYHINYSNKITFVRDGSQRWVNKSDYFNLDIGEEVVCNEVGHITELGDNISYKSETKTGIPQYIRDNVFFNNATEYTITYFETEIAEMVDHSNRYVGCIPYKVEWRGDFSLEPFDKLRVEAKDGSYINLDIINDTFFYNGGFKHTASWTFTPEEATTTAPTSIGDIITQTTARVDKVNKEITLLASEAEANREEIASIKINTESINASVKAVEESTQNALENMDNTIAEMESRLTQTADNLNISFTQKIDNIDSITTSTGYTFNRDGLTVSKDTSDITTTITENGMTVSKLNEPVLTANNDGVLAENLQANNFLIIDGKTRFEYMSGTQRIGCFWIGG